MIQKLNKFIEYSKNLGVYNVSAPIGSDFGIWFSNFMNEERSKGHIINNLKVSNTGDKTFTYMGMRFYLINATNIN